MKKLLFASLAAIGTLLNAAAFAPTDSVPAPRVPLPEKAVASTVAERKAAPADKRQLPAKYAPASGYTLYGHNATFEYGNIAGNYRLDYDLNQEHLFTDQYVGQYYTFPQGWIRNGNLCGVFDKSLFSIIDYRYVEMDPYTGVILKDEQINIQDPVTTFYNYLPVYITAAYDPDEDKLYGYTCSESGNGYAFFTAPGNNPAKTVAVIPDVAYKQVCTSLAYNSKDGLFYGVNRENKLVKITKEGVQTEVMDLNMQTRYSRTGLVYIPEQDRFIWQAYLTDYSCTLQEIDYNAKTLTELAAFDNLEQYTFFYRLPNAQDPAPIKRPELDETRFDHLNGSGVISYFMPTEYFSGGTVSGSLDYFTEVDGDPGQQGSANAGDAVAVNVSNLSTGEHTFKCYVRKGSEASTVHTMTCYVGVDTPLATESVTLTESRVEWQPVNRGVNGGFLDPKEMKYHVYINDEEVGTTQNTYLDYSLPQDRPYANYTAYVSVDNHGMMSEKTASESMRFGKPWEMDVDIAPTLEQAKVFSAFSLDDDDSWASYTQNDGLLSFVVPLSKDTNNDWLFTPPLYFDNPYTSYEISYDVRNGDKDYTNQRIGVYLHKKLDPREKEAEIQAPRVFSNTEYTTITQRFAVSEPGTYYISFFNDNGPYERGLRIRNIKIKKLSSGTELPSAVSDVKATAADKGELKATIAFKMPTEYITGQAIAADKEIHVIARRADNHIEINGTPGSEHTFVMDTEQGDNNITLTTYIDGQNGQETSVQVFTGVDVPGPVSSISGSISENNRKLTMQWTAPTESENGYYINPADVDYIILKYGGEGWEVVENLGKNVFTYDYEVPAGSPLASVRLGVAPATVQGRSSTTGYLWDVLGTPYTPPYTENFTDAKFTYGPIRVIRTLSDEYAEAEWGVVNPRLISPDMEIESNVAAYGRSETPGTRGMLSLPKFNAKAVSSPGIVFNFWTGANAAQTRVLAECYGCDDFIDLGTVPANGSGWQEVSFPLPDELKNKEWVGIFLDSYFADATKYCLFSNYTVKGGVTGIAETKVADAGIVRTMNGAIDLSGFEGMSVAVYGMDGRTVKYVKSAPANMTIDVAPGIYLVKAGQATKKVLVK